MTRPEWHEKLRAELLAFQSACSPHTKPIKELMKEHPDQTEELLDLGASVLVCVDTTERRRFGLQSAMLTRSFDAASEHIAYELCWVLHAALVAINSAKEK